MPLKRVAWIGTGHNKSSTSTSRHDHPTIHSLTHQDGTSANRKPIQLIYKPMAPPHPLRRISTGSLSSLHRSQDRQHTSPSGLDFLSPALIDLSDEATTLAGNVEKLNELHDALGTFNESFAGWLYAMKMNAFCVEWPEVSCCLHEWHPTFKLYLAHALYHIHAGLYQR